MNFEIFCMKIVHCWFLWTFSNFVIHVPTVYRDDMHYQGNVVELMRDDFLFCFCQYLEVERTGKWHKACSATYCKKMLFWCSEACVNSPWNLWLMDHQIQSMISDHKYFLYSNSECIYIHVHVSIITEFHFAEFLSPLFLQVTRTSIQSSVPAAPVIHSTKCWPSFQNQWYVYKCHQTIFMCSSI